MHGYEAGIGEAMERGAGADHPDAIQQAVLRTGMGQEHDASKLLTVLEGLPFRDEVTGGRDFRGAALSGGVKELNFSGWDFSYVRSLFNLIRCNLRSARFDEATLGAGLSGDLSGASFMGAKMNGSSIVRSRAHGCCFDGAILNGALLEDTDFTGSSFVGADARSADFTGATLLGCDFRDARLDAANFRNIKLDKTTDLRGASLINLGNDDHRDYSGKLVSPGTDWRLATYDETTVYGEDPAIPELETMAGAIAALRSRPEPEAATLIVRLEQMRASVSKNFRYTWYGELLDLCSPAEKELFETIMDEERM